MTAETRPQLLYALRRLARSCDSKSQFAAFLVEAIAEIEALDDENIELKARLLKAERAEAAVPRFEPLTPEQREDRDLHSLILHKHEYDEERKCHVLRVGKRVQRVAYGACGCCLVKVFKIVRDKGVLKEGATFSCHETCPPGPGHEWIVKDGVLRWAENKP
jgi:hypothetical protein